MFTSQEAELYRNMSNELGKYNSEAWKSGDYRKYMNGKEEEVRKQFGAEKTVTDMRLAANGQVDRTVDNVRD